MDSINKRLAEILLKEKGLNAYKISKQTGFPPASIDNWLKGKNGKFVMPGADAVAKLCLTYNIDIEHIMLGKLRNKIKKKTEVELMQELIEALQSENRFLKSNLKK